MAVTTSDPRSGHERGVSLSNPQDVPRFMEDDVDDAAERAAAAGARPPLRFLGVGSTGVVLCDRFARGFKVARAHAVHLLEAEAEWLAAASSAPEIRRHVARFVRYHPELAVLERECVRADRPPPAGRGGDRRDLHAVLSDVMSRYGYTRPEYKDDSYVYQRGRGWVLVDAGFTNVRGTRLAARAAQMLRGRRFANESPSDVAWALRMEAGRTVPERVAARLSDELLALPDAGVVPRTSRDRRRASTFNRRSRRLGRH